MDIKESEILGDTIGDHWYYRSKAKAMVNYLPTPISETILDVGAGSGFFSRYLLNETNAQTAWLVDTGYASDSDEVANGKSIHLRRGLDVCDAGLVLLMDVLEHVDDDVGLLTHYVDAVPSGSHIFITVPAFQFLWSGHDDFLEHKRRYKLPALEDVAKASNLEIVRSAYFFGSVFPIAAALRLAGRFGAPGEPKSQLKNHHPIVNSALSAVCGIEAKMFGWNRMAGLSVFCLARKP